MAWIECTKSDYWKAVESGDNVVTVDRECTIWRTRLGQPVAKSSQGYIPETAPEVLCVWRADHKEAEDHDNQ